MHPLNFIVLNILYICTIYKISYCPYYIVILILAYLNLNILTKQIRYRNIGIFLIGMLPIMIVAFLSSYLYAKNSNSAIHTAFFLSFRYFCLTLIAFSFSIHIPYTALLSYLMQRKILSINIGYALLAAFNSLSHLGEEFNRIRLSNKMRSNKWIINPGTLISLLVATVRYAQNLSINLHNRKLNPHKTFVMKINPLKHVDYAICIVNLIVCIILQIMI